MKVILFFIALLLFVIGCSDDSAKTIQKTQTHEYPDQESWDATIVITRNGKKSGKLAAGHVRKYSDKMITLLDEGIKVDFFDETGQHTSVLTANGGKVFDQRQDMLAYGNVVVVSDSGMTMHTDTLKWDNKNQKIFSEIAVIFTTNENDTLYGDSFVSDPNLDNYEIVNARGKSSKRINLE